jgi:hypothetical protein
MSDTARKAPEGSTPMCDGCATRIRGAGRRFHTLWPQAEIDPRDGQPKRDPDTNELVRITGYCPECGHSDQPLNDVRLVNKTDTREGVGSHPTPQVDVHVNFDHLPEPTG